MRFLTPAEGQLLVKAPGLLKSGSKLAPLLQYGDELKISLARGHSRTATLTGVTLERPHDCWRRSLRPLALLWLMLESTAVSSSTPAVNAAAYQLVVNLLRSEPEEEDALAGALCVFCLKLLALHGLAPDLLNCSESGVPFTESEPVFLLPTGEGLLGRETYNRTYARRSSDLARIDPLRRRRWTLLLHGPLLRYGERGCNAEDAALLLGMLARQISHLAGQELGSARHLAQAWRLPAVDQAPA